MGDGGCDGISVVGESWCVSRPGLSPSPRPQSVRFSVRRLYCHGDSLDQVPDRDSHPQVSVGRGEEEGEGTTRESRSSTLQGSCSSSSGLGQGLCWVRGRKQIRLGLFGRVAAFNFHVYSYSLSNIQVSESVQLPLQSPELLRVVIHSMVKK